MVNILTLIIKRIKTNHTHLNKRTVLFTHPISCYIIKKTCKVTHADNLWILLCLWSFDVDKSLAYGNKSTSLNFHWAILYGHYMSQYHCKYCENWIVRSSGADDKQLCSENVFRPKKKFPIRSVSQLTCAQSQFC